MKYILILLTCIAFTSVGQTIKYTINNGLQIEGVNTDNPVIYDNDMVQDTPDIFYLWLKANRKEVNLVGNVNTKDMHPAVYTRPHDNTFNVWMKFYNAYTANGMKNVPTPVKGSARYFNAASVENSAGSDLIIAEAKKASPAKPLVIIVGGQATSVANAFAKDRSIRDNIIVFHVDGFGDTDYNAVDDKACLELINGGVKYINWDGNLNSWYNKSGSPMYSGSNKMPGITLVGLPNNSFANELRNNWFNQAFAQWGDIGDAPPIFYFFNNALWQNVARKNIQNQTVTVDNFAFLLVSQNKWTDYGPQLNSYIVNPANYIPVTTAPPVNNPPSVVLNVGASYPAGAVTLYADASDSDGSVSKVEFLVAGNKIGEDLSSPYGFVWNATEGTYNVSARAIDNLGFSSTSTKSVTITSVTVPPVEPPTGQKIFNIVDFGADGSGQTDSRAAIQAAIDAAIKAQGKLIIPAPNNFYRINSTLNIQPIAPESQAYITIEGNGKYWSQIVYMGPSNSSAVNIIGLKGGSSIQGLHVAIGDNISNTAAIEIGNTEVAGSTSAFSLRNCTANLNTGINNIGIRFGKIQGGTGNDISQIELNNVNVWGPFRLIPGQIGILFMGNNALGFTIEAGGIVFCETAVKITSGGVISILGLGTTHNGIEYHLAHSTQLSITGGRYELSKQFMVVEQSANFPGVSVSGVLLSEFKPENGKLIDFRAPGGLILDNLKIESSVDYGPGMITLGTNAGGSLFVRGGAFNASDPFITQGAWRVKVDNVVKMNRDYQSVGFFNNK